MVSHHALHPTRLAGHSARVRNYFCKAHGLALAADLRSFVLLLYRFNLLGKRLVVLLLRCCSAVPAAAQRTHACYSQHLLAARPATFLGKLCFLLAATEASKL